jgi:hypothetical protein
MKEINNGRNGIQVILVGNLNERKLEPSILNIGELEADKKYDLFLGCIHSKKKFGGAWNASPSELSGYIFANWKGKEGYLAYVAPSNGRNK